MVVHATDTSAAPASIGSLSSGVKDEYDPARPNDYEEICREREQQQRNAVAEAERQERLKAEAAAREASLPVSEALCSAAALTRLFIFSDSQASGRLKVGSAAQTLASLSPGPHQAAVLRARPDRATL